MRLCEHTVLRISYVPIRVGYRYVRITYFADLQTGQKSIITVLNIIRMHYGVCSYHDQAKLEIATETPKYRTALCDLRMQRIAPRLVKCRACRLCRLAPLPK